ncbi:MAG: DUF2283 domain-containing protein [archaeon]
MKNILRCKGLVDYDYKYDILFFKSAEKAYAKSIELDSIVVDIDPKGFIMGIQIFDASKFFNLKKSDLLKVGKWEFRSSVNDGRIEIRLLFRVVVRNKVIEKNPIIIEPLPFSLPNSELICEVN